MKKIFITGVLSIICHSASAQEKVIPDFDKNHVKLNLFALPLRSFSLQYERGLNENMSVAMGLRLQPKGGIPFRNSIKNSYDADSIDIDFLDNARISSWAITPEFRYYLGKQPLGGFYLAPYIRIEGNSLEWRYKFEENDGDIRDIDFNGKTSGVSGGLLLGAQWHVGKRFLIDWWIAGFSYGSYKVTLKGTGDISDLDAEDRKEIEESIESTGFGNNSFNATITNNSVTADVKVPIPGLRTGLCIGYKF